MNIIDQILKPTKIDDNLKVRIHNLTLDYLNFKCNNSKLHEYKDYLLILSIISLTFDRDLIRHFKKNKKDIFLQRLLNYENYKYTKNFIFYPIPEIRYFDYIETLMIYYSTTKLSENALKIFYDEFIRLLQYDDYTVLESILNFSEVNNPWYYKIQKLIDKIKLHTYIYNFNNRFEYLVQVKHILFNYNII